MARARFVSHPSAGCGTYRHGLGEGMMEPSGDNVRETVCREHTRASGETAQLAGLDRDAGSEATAATAANFYVAERSQRRLVATEFPNLISTEPTLSARSVNLKPS